MSRMRFQECFECGVIFSTDHHSAQFCSKKCRKISQHILRKLSAAIYNRLSYELQRKYRAPISTARQLLGCTLREFRLKLEDQFQPGMNWHNHGKWHIDHIRPIVMFDLTDFEQQRQCFHFSNFQPLWAKDNLRKRRKCL